MMDDVLTTVWWVASNLTELNGIWSTLQVQDMCYVHAYTRFCSQHVAGRGAVDRDQCASCMDNDGQADLRWSTLVMRFQMNAINVNHVLGLTASKFAL